jgi:hypothetical protein
MWCREGSIILSAYGPFHGLDIPQQGVVAMGAWKLAAPGALFVMSVTGQAGADNVSKIGIKNAEHRAVTVEYRIGNFADCDRNNDYVGKQTIAPKGKWVVKIGSEKFCCLRIFGTTKWMRKDLRRGKDYEFTIR